MLRTLRASVLPLLLAFATVGAGCGGDASSTPAPAVSASATTSATSSPAPAGTIIIATPVPTATATAAPTLPPAPLPATGHPPLGTPAGVATTIRDPAFAPLAGARALAGTLGGAAYRIEVPANWNGSLVLFAHGYRGEGTEVFVSNPPRALREAFIQQGYAWAASSYRENGYVPGLGADDTLALKRHFATVVGEPRRTYLVGESMGGAVTALSLERLPGEYDGALAVCGALGGQEQIDYLAAWAMAAEFASGTRIPIGEAGLTTNLLLGLGSVLGSPDAPTERGRVFLSLVRELTGGPRPFFLEGLKEQYQANFLFLLVDPRRAMPVSRAASTEGIRYGIEPGLGYTAEEVNAAIRRIPAVGDIRGSEAYPDRAPTTGRLTAPLLTLHNTGDLFVPISQEVSYLARARAAGTGDLLVQRAIRAGGHCLFSDAELLTAWNDLRAWVEGGQRPAGDDLSGDLTDIGRAFTNPLRTGDPGTK